MADFSRTHDVQFTHAAIGPSMPVLRFMDSYSQPGRCSLIEVPYPVPCVVVVGWVVIAGCMSPIVVGATPRRLRLDLDMRRRPRRGIRCRGSMTTPRSLTRRVLRVRHRCKSEMESELKDVLNVLV